MAGPHQNKTGITPSVDEITQAGLGASANTATTGAPPPIPGTGNPARGLDFQVQQPSWVSPPSNDDFGQRDTRKDNYDTGLVVTPQQAFPFPALANRQMANQQRKDALAKKVADFNLYGGVGKAHDRYQTAFNQYATSEMDQGLRDQAEARFGGDMNAAREWAATTPEGQEWWHRLSGTVEAVGQENKATVQDSINTLAKVTGEGFYVPPDKLKMVIEHANAIDHNGMPVKGQGGPGEFLDRVRGAEATMQEIQYVNKVLDPILKDAFRTTVGFNIEDRKVGGKYQLTETETKTFGDAIDHALDLNPGYVEAYYGGDKERAKAELARYYPTSVKETVKLESPHTPAQGSGSPGTPESGFIATYNAFNPQATGFAENRPTSDNKNPVQPSGQIKLSKLREAGANIPSKAQRVDEIVFYDETSGKGQFPKPRQMSDGDYMHITATVRDQDGKLWVYGKRAKAPGATGASSVSNLYGGEDDVTSIQEFTQLEDVVKRYDMNKGNVSGAYPGYTEQAIRSTMDAGVAALPKRAGAQKQAQPSDIDALLEKYK